MQQIVESVASRRRGIDDVLYREHVFMQRSMGWFSHLAEYITRITNRPSDGWNVDTSVREAYDRTLAIERLLMLKIAIRAYQLDHGRLPSQLTQLVPDYIPALPIDPFDPSGQPPRFQNKGDDYLLYSVGQDGYDDGGQPQSYPIPFDQTIPDGDITLEGQFPPDTADQNQPKSGGDAKAQPETAQSPLPN